MYINRWKVEIFFKWIKQNLGIKRFWGETPNAVKTQIWIAVSTFVLVAIVKREINAPYTLNELLQILSISVFDKTPVNQLDMNYKNTFDKPDDHNQLNIYDF